MFNITYKIKCMFSQEIRMTDYQILSLLQYYMIYVLRDFYLVIFYQQLLKKSHSKDSEFTIGPAEQCGEIYVL